MGEPALEGLPIDAGIGIDGGHLVHQRAVGVQTELGRALAGHLVDALQKVRRQQAAFDAKGLGVHG